MSSTNKWLKTCISCLYTSIWGRFLIQVNCVQNMLTWIRKPILKRVPNPSQHPIHRNMCVCTALSEGLDPATATRASAKRRNFPFFGGGEGGSLLFSQILGVCVSHQVLVMHSLRFRYAFMHGDKPHEARKRKTGRGGDGQYNGKLPPKQFLNLGEVSGNKKFETGNKNSNYLKWPKTNSPNISDR